MSRATAGGVAVVEADVFDAEIPLGEGRLVYADPPYTEEDFFGYGGFRTWQRLVDRMHELGAPDAAYVLHMGSANLASVLPYVEDTAPRRRRRSPATVRVRVIPWVKPWGAWRPGLAFQYQWEPILVWYGPRFAQPRSVRYVDEADWIAYPPQKPKWGHPTEKPAFVVQRLLSRLCIGGEGRLAVDLFAGSGTAAVLAARHAMRVLAVERDPGYCETIRARARAEAFALFPPLEDGFGQERLFPSESDGPRPRTFHALGKRNRRRGSHLERADRAGENAA